MVNPVGSSRGPGVFYDSGEAGGVAEPEGPVLYQGRDELYIGLFDGLPFAEDMPKLNTSARQSFLSGIGGRLTEIEMALIIRTRRKNNPEEKPSVIAQTFINQLEQYFAAVPADDRFSKLILVIRIAESLLVLGRIKEKERDKAGAKKDFLRAQRIAAALNGAAPQNYVVGSDPLVEEAISQPTFWGGTWEQTLNKQFISYSLLRLHCLYGLASKQAKDYDVAISQFNLVVGGVGTDPQRRTVSQVDRAALNYIQYDYFLEAQIELIEAYAAKEQFDQVAAEQQKAITMIEQNFNEHNSKIWAPDLIIRLSTAIYYAYEKSDTAKAAELKAARAELVRAIQDNCVQMTQQSKQGEYDAFVKLLDLMGITSARVKKCIRQIIFNSNDTKNSIQDSAHLKLYETLVFNVYFSDIDKEDDYSKDVQAAMDTYESARFETDLAQAKKMKDAAKDKLLAAIQEIKDDMRQSDDDTQQLYNDYKLLEWAYGSDLYAEMIAPPDDPDQGRKIVIGMVLSLYEVDFKIEQELIDSAKSLAKESTPLSLVLSIPREDINRPARILALAGAVRSLDQYADAYPVAQQIYQWVIDKNDAATKNEAILGKSECQLGQFAAEYKGLTDKPSRGLTAAGRQEMAGIIKEDIIPALSGITDEKLFVRTQLALGWAYSLLYDLRKDVMSDAEKRAALEGAEKSYQAIVDKGEEATQADLKKSEATFATVLYRLAEIRKNLGEFVTEEGEFATEKYKLAIEGFEAIKDTESCYWQARMGYAEAYLGRGLQTGSQEDIGKAVSAAEGILRGMPAPVEGDEEAKEIADDIYCRIGEVYKRAKEYEKAATKGQSKVAGEVIANSPYLRVAETSLVYDRAQVGLAETLIAWAKDKNQSLDAAARGNKAVEAKNIALAIFDRLAEKAKIQGGLTVEQQDVLLRSIQVLGGFYGFQAEQAEASLDPETYKTAGDEWKKLLALYAAMLGDEYLQTLPQESRDLLSGAIKEYEEGKDSDLQKVIGALRGGLAPLLGARLDAKAYFTFGEIFKAAGKSNPTFIGQANEFYQAAVREAQAEEKRILEARAQMGLAEVTVMSVQEEIKAAGGDAKKVADAKTKLEGAIAELKKLSGIVADPILDSVPAGEEKNELIVKANVLLAWAYSTLADSQKLSDPRTAYDNFVEAAEVYQTLALDYDPALLVRAGYSLEQMQFNYLDLRKVCAGMLFDYADQLSGGQIAAAEEMFKQVLQGLEGLAAQAGLEPESYFGISASLMETYLYLAKIKEQQLVIWETKKDEDEANDETEKTKSAEFYYGKAVEIGKKYFSADVLDTSLLITQVSTSTDGKDGISLSDAVAKNRKLAAAAYKCAQQYAQSLLAESKFKDKYWFSFDAQGAVENEALAAAAILWFLLPVEEAQEEGYRAGVAKDHYVNYAPVSESERYLRGNYEALFGQIFAKGIGKEANANNADIALAAASAMTEIGKFADAAAVLGATLPQAASEPLLAARLNFALANLYCWNDWKGAGPDRYATADQYFADSETAYKSAVEKGSLIEKGFEYVRAQNEILLGRAYCQKEQRAYQKAADFFKQAITALEGKIEAINQTPTGNPAFEAEIHLQYLRALFGLYNLYIWAKKGGQPYYIIGDKRIFNRIFKIIPAREISQRDIDEIQNKIGQEQSWLTDQLAAATGSGSSAQAEFLGKEKKKSEILLGLLRADQKVYSEHVYVKDKQSQDAVLDEYSAVEKLIANSGETPSAPDWVFETEEAPEWMARIWMARGFIYADNHKFTEAVQAYRIAQDYAKQIREGASAKARMLEEIEAALNGAQANEINYLPYSFTLRWVNERSEYAPAGAVNIFHGVRGTFAATISDRFKLGGTYAYGDFFRQAQLGNGRFFSSREGGDIQVDASWLPKPHYFGNYKLSSEVLGGGDFYWLDFMLYDERAISPADWHKLYSYRAVTASLTLKETLALPAVEDGSTYTALSWEASVAPGWADPSPMGNTDRPDNGALPDAWSFYTQLVSSWTLRHRKGPLGLGSSFSLGPRLARDYINTTSNYFYPDPDHPWSATASASAVIRNRIETRWFSGLGNVSLLAGVPFGNAGTLYLNPEISLDVLLPARLLPERLRLQLASGATFSQDSIYDPANVINSSKSVYGSLRVGF